MVEEGGEMTDERKVKKVFVENVLCKRARGRPRKWWTDDLRITEHLID